MRKTDVRFKQDIPVAQGFDASAGDQKQFPVEATVPMFQSTRAGGSITYSLKAVVAVKGRPDLTAEFKPSVMPATVVTQVTQVIQREVVKVPCKYCGALIEVTSGTNKCPNCGAFLSG